MGHHEVSVSTFAQGIVGAKDENGSYGHGAVAGDVVGGETVKVDTRIGVLTSTPVPVTRWPRGVCISAVGVVGEPILIHGVSPGQRVMIFGQKFVPIVCVVPCRVRPGESVSIAIPSAHNGETLSGMSPGIIFVQVLAPDQSATGAEVRRMLIVPDQIMALEIDALMRGAGGIDERKCNALPPIAGYRDLAAFNMFHDDLGCVLQGHHHSQLYTPDGRRTVRGFAADFDRFVNPTDTPASHRPAHCSCSLTPPTFI